MSQAKRGFGWVPVRARVARACVLTLLVSGLGLSLAGCGGADGTGSAGTAGTSSTNPFANASSGSTSGTTGSSSGGSSTTSGASSGAAQGGSTASTTGGTTSAGTAGGTVSSGTPGGTLSTGTPAGSVSSGTTGSGTTATTSSITFAWQPPTENTDGTPIHDLAGYKIHYGTASANYTQVISINNSGLTRYVLENLARGTYYFAITAFNSKGLESGLSGEVTATLN